MLSIQEVGDNENSSTENQVTCTDAKESRTQYPENMQNAYKSIKSKAYLLPHHVKCG